MTDLLPELQNGRVVSGGGGGSSGSHDLLPELQGGRVVRGAASPKKQGPGGFFHNAISDPINAAVGSLPAVYHASTAFGMDVGDVISGRKPTHVYRTIVEPLGRDPLVQDLWAARHPLRSSSIYNYLTGGKQPESQLVTQVKQGHLLVPALDVLGVASFGGARVGALAALPEDATAAEIRAAALRGRTAGKLGTITVRDTPTGAPITVRTLPRNAYQAARMQATDKALKAATHEYERIFGKPWGSTPLVGESVRASRAVAKAEQKVKLTHLADLRFAEYQQAFTRLTKEQRVALAALSKVPLPKDLAGWKTILADQEGEPAQRLLAALSDPKTMEAYGAFGTDAGSKRLARAHEAAVALVGQREEILARTGALSPEAALESSYGASRVARGAEFVTPETYRARIADIDRTLGELGADIRATVRGARTVGKPEIRAEIAVAGDLARQAARGSRVRGKYRQIVGGMDAARFEASSLRAQVEKIMGGTIDTDTLSRLGFNVRPGSDLAGMRLKALGVLYDRVGPAYDRLEKTMAAAHGLEREMAHGAEIAAAQGRSAAALRRAREARIAALRAERAALEELTSLRGSMELLREEIRAGGFNRLVGGGTPEEIAAEITAAGRPQPFYTPDVPAASRQSRAAFSRSGGRTPPTSDVRVSQRILFRMGQLALHPDLLTPSFLRAVAFDAKLAKHEEVKSIATPIAADAHLPADMEWVREVRGEKIPFTLSSAGEHLKEMDQVFPEDKPLTVKEGEGEIAVDAEGRRLAVSRALAKRLETKVHETNVVVKWLVQKPLDVWRALVLNWRIPWLLNNIVGNHILFALRFAGANGLQSYVALLSEPAKRRLFQSHVTKSGMTLEDQARVFPEQFRGTFLGVNAPTVSGKLGKIVKTAGLGVAKLDVATERRLRLASTNAVLRGSPEVKALYRAMPTETRSLREAMLKATADHPELRELANSEANRALGDYLSLSDAERTYVRRVAPFYGWYREILRIAAHAVVDTPIRTAFLARFALVEQERQQDLRGPFPSYLEGSVALGAGPQGTERILALRSANPLSTVADEIRAASFLAGDHSRASASAVLGMGNPFAVGLLEYLTAAAKGDPTRLTYQGPVADTLSRGGPIGAMAGEVFGGLPQTQVIAPPPPSKLYPTRDRNELLLRLLGDIRRNVNLQQAHLYESQGR